MLSAVPLRLTSSPCAWGCFLRRLIRWASKSVFPTCVGVFPTKTGGGRVVASLPHVRGGVFERMRESAIGLAVVARAVSIRL